MELRFQPASLPDPPPLECDLGSVFVIQAWPHLFKIVYCWNVSKLTEPYNISTFILQG